MPLNLVNEIDRIASVDLFQRDSASGNLAAGQFVGRPFALGYDRARLLVADAKKRQAGGIPQGAFLLAYYENEEDVLEALLLRVLGPTPLPTDNDVIASMVEYYKDNLDTSGRQNQLDTFTRYEFSFSGLECRILGTFYRGPENRTFFGADVENFYSAHNYRVVKPHAKALEKIVNFREGDVTGRPTDIRIGRVRYASARRFGARAEEVPVYVSPADFLGKRTALFGMTRTGKSNTVKKIIQATAAMSDQAPHRLASNGSAGDGAANLFAPADTLDPFTKEGLPKYPVGQIVFDINGEYANANLQDAGTAIFDLYKERTTRYSVIEKGDDFKVMKVNFYQDILSGFELARSFLADESSDYVRNFTSVDLTPPADQSDRSATTRHARREAAYLACLHRASFPLPEGFRLTFPGEKTTINEWSGIDPSQGISPDEAVTWFSSVWENQGDPFFANYKKKKGKEWADEDLKAILVMLTRRRNPSADKPDASGYLKLRSLVGLHTPSVDRPFQEAITDELRQGRIVLVDLSQGDPGIQRLYSERICRHLFADAMSRFIKNDPVNFLQFYFEEAHNLFPKKDDKDLAQVYNRIAKEGAKLSLGLVYATQEVSSISSNILKNTQNWFIAHLNNEDETRELRKYYDFADFTDSLVRFSAASDKGFVRMKAYSNPFVVPVQVDRFAADTPGAGSSTSEA